MTISVGPPEVEAAEATADNSGAPPVPVGNGDVAPAPEGNGGGAPAPEGNGGGAAATEGNGGGPPAMDGNGGGPTAASSPRVLRSECLPRSYAPRTFTLSRQVNPPSPFNPSPPSSALRPIANALPIALLLCDVITFE